MKKNILFICLLFINAVVFGQTEADRTAYFQEQLQILKGIENPIFVKIEIGEKTETILKTDAERIEQFKENADKYYVHHVENIPIKTTITKWEERKNVDKNCCFGNLEDCKVWMLIEFPVDVVETVKTYRVKLNNFMEHPEFKKYYPKVRQKAIDEFQPIYAKIQTENKGEEVVLKKDSVKIKEIISFPEKYIFEKEDIINIETNTTQWVRRQVNNCCLGSNLEDCITWDLVEVPVYATDTIKIYKLKSVAKKAEIDNEKYLFGTPEHEKYKAEECQKGIDETQPIYAKIQIQTEKGLVEKIILKTDTVSIQSLELHSENYTLQDVEFVTFEVVDFEYWVKKTSKDKGVNCSNIDDCLVWCMVEIPKFTVTETIQIFRFVDKQVETTESEVLIKTDIPSNEIQYKIYPNPFSNQITITSTALIKNVVIFDELGHRVLETIIQNTEKTIDLADLQQGVYFVQVFTKDNKKTLKIIKE